MLCENSPRHAAKLIAKDSSVFKRLFSEGYLCGSTNLRVSVKASINKEPVLLLIMLLETVTYDGILLNGTKSIRKLRQLLLQSHMTSWSLMLSTLSLTFWRLNLSFGGLRSSEAHRKMEKFCLLISRSLQSTLSRNWLVI